ncbi:MAG: DUF1877 family protein [Planctomycetes bacterium]|nr:DUF1877 family protein [Planctomycetota bacterium]
MSGGVHLSLDREASKRLFVCSDEELRSFVDEFSANEDNRQEGLVLVADDVWMTLHRCLTDGTLDPTAGEFPLNHCFLGGRQLSRASGFSVTLVRPDMTRHVADAISQLADDDLRARYDQHFGQTAGANDLEDAIPALRKLGEFFNTASSLHHAVVFAAEIQPG